jgi:uncharacterized protein (DUF2062 family)
MRQMLRKWIPFLGAILIGAMAAALVIGVAIFVSHS